jgi:hypothetical protein
MSGCSGARATGATVSTCLTSSADFCGGFVGSAAAAPPDKGEDNFPRIDPNDVTWFIRARICSLSDGKVELDRTPKELG